MKDYFGKDLTIIKNKKLYLFYMDGTIYLGKMLFDGVSTLLSRIKESGGRYVFITNNSSKSVDDYVVHLKSMGLDVTREDFFTSAQAAEILLKEKFGTALIYTQGTDSFVRQLKDSGLNITTRYDENVKCVIVGFDTEITGEKLKNTCEVLSKIKDVPYYATNPDWVCPVEFGYIPDCGSMCFGIEKATGRKPVYIGKPEPEMINIVTEKFGYKKDDVVVLGDRLYTDIAAGVNAGVDTIMVLSGEATLKDYEDSTFKPTFLLNSVKDLL